MDRTGQEVDRQPLQDLLKDYCDPPHQSQFYCFCCFRPPIVSIAGKVIASPLLVLAQQLYYIIRINVLGDDICGRIAKEYKNINSPKRVQVHCRPI